jgi:peptide/nickel transport system substrate-binding protein
MIHDVTRRTRALHSNHTTFALLGALAVGASLLLTGCSKSDAVIRMSNARKH